MNILAIDPGKTTGWATWQRGEWNAGEHEDWYTMCHWLREITYLFDVLICEEFRITTATAKKSPQPWSLEMIGVLKFLRWDRGQPPPVMQSPADAMKFATNDKLKKANMYSVGQEHARDASRHLLLYLVRNSREIGFDTSQLL